MSRDDELITIRNFSYGPDPVSEAEIARLKLEEEGIQCFLAGKNFISTHWLLSGVGGGVKLQVLRADAPRALEILGRNEPIAFDPTEANDPEPEQSYPVCSKCGSDNVDYAKFSRALFYLGVMFFRIPLPYRSKKYKCLDCGAVWT
jgi:hypothetical protein